MRHDRRLLLRSLIGAACAWLVGCPSPPPVTPPPPPECLHVDGRGGIDADGSSAHPLRAIDDAVARLGASGGVVCLDPGDHAPPLAPIATAITLRGTVRDETRITARVGPCLTTLGIEDLPPSGTTHASDTLLETGADATLEHLTLSGCSIGVHATLGALTLDDVSIEDVSAGVVLASGTSVDASQTSIAIARSSETSSVAPGGIVSVRAAHVHLGAGTDISGFGAALYLVDVDVDVESARLHDLAVGLALLDNSGDRRIRLTDTTIEDVTLGDAGLNAMIGGRLEMTRTTIRDAELFGLALDGVAARISACTFEGDRVLLRVQGGTADLMDGAHFVGGTISLAAAPAELTGGAPAVVRVMGAMDSDGGSVVHAFADRGAALTLEGEGNHFTGGMLGLAAYGGSHVAVMHDLTVEGAQIAVGGFDVGTTMSVTGLVATGFELGVLTSEATTTLTAPMLTGGQHALGVRSGTLDVSSGTIADTSSSGVRVLSGAVTLAMTNVDGAGGPGVSAEGGSVALDMVRITNSEDVGAIADGGATLTVLDTTFEANVGAALAIYAGSVSVEGGTFLGSRPSASGRQDEIRIVADGVPATLALNDRNLFLLSGVACAPDTCSVILASGVGADAIVRPNCITAPDADVMQGLAQDGGTITETTEWLTERVVAGALVDPGAFPGLPTVRADPPVPTGGFMGIAP